MGFRIEAQGKVVAIAGDTVPCEGLSRLCRGADVYVQTVIRRDIIEKAPFKRFRDVLDYHSDVAQAGKTAADCGVRTLVLNHPVPAPQPGSEPQWIALAKAHFGGEVLLATDLLTVDA
jgi:ribonuclease Z